MAAKTKTTYTYSPEKVCKHVVKYTADSATAPVESLYITKAWLAQNGKTDTSSVAVTFQ